MTNLLQDINNETQLIKEFEETLGIPREEFPEELLAEISGAAMAIAGEREWMSDLAQQQTAQRSYAGAAPREIPSGEDEVQPKTGDFVKVGNDLLKVRGVEQKFGQAFVMFDQPGAKPVPLNRLTLDRTISGRQVFGTTGGIGPGAGPQTRDQFGRVR